MAARWILIPLMLSAAACTAEEAKPFPVDATISPEEGVTVPVANYGQPPQYASFSVKNNMGSVLYISPAIPSGDLSDLLVINVPAYSQVVPGQTKPVQVTIDYRPWRWKTGDYTATVPFEVRYFFSGQAADEAEDPSTTAKPKSVVDVIELKVNFSIDCDLDDDGADAWQCGGTDCDDAREDVYLGADETCDHVDQDCNGAVDDDPLEPRSWWVDGDGDGYGDPATRVDACDKPSQDYVNRGDDCNDDSRSVNPFQFENCYNDVDDNCDGLTDTEDRRTCPI
jgi:hypothetical protein